jgi:hypothetical protein
MIKEHRYVPKTTEEKICYMVESLRFEFLEMVHEKLNNGTMTLRKLAKRLGIFVKELRVILGDSFNLTIENMSEIAVALGFELYLCKQ